MDELGTEGGGADGERRRRLGHSRAFKTAVSVIP